VKSAVVTELELSNCLMPYRNSPCFKHLTLKTLKNKEKITPGTAINVRSIY
jgi:hypothetical protein